MTTGRRPIGPDEQRLSLGWPEGWVPPGLHPDQWAELPGRGREAVYTALVEQAWRDLATQMNRLRDLGQCPSMAHSDRTGPAGILVGYDRRLENEPGQGWRVVYNESIPLGDLYLEDLRPHREMPSELDKRSDIP
ncbi:hypothetical protein [Streptacidiphilus cavernicola]|uniref:Uncharacterized protein n=1 Tax=Streptacidiphilus cavernicola TaxID=3342716 RepID=A0ABV6VY79_9ACTN